MDQAALRLLVLAALLHDVGKFAQRAERPKDDRMAGEYCPTDKGRPTHVHVLYTEHFIEHDLPLPPELEPERGRLARLASAHHKPAESDLLEKALSVADRLSAGADRIREDSEAGDYKTARLACVLETVRLESKEGQEDRTGRTGKYSRYYPLRPIDQDAFPVSLEEARRSGYRELFDQFLAALKALPLDMGVAHYTAALITILERFTWCVPSSTYHTEPDVSLYDHALTTAAIAQALAVHHAQAGGLPGQGVDKTAKFILCGGDLSGIQRYIFGVEKSHGAGVAKLYRARSFLLQALTKSVILALLDGLGLAGVARIMDAGGRFILLLPATPETRERLTGFETEVQRWFLDKFQGALSLNLSYAVELTEQDMELTRFRLRLDDFNDHLERRKLAKFDRLLAAGLDPVMGQDYQRFADGVCAVCNTRPVDPEKSEQFAKAHDNKAAAICRDCWLQIERIGSKLPREDVKYVIFGRDKAQGGVRLFDGVTMRFLDGQPGREHAAALDIVNIRDRESFAYHAVAGHMPLVREEDQLKWLERGKLSQKDGEKLFFGEDPFEQGQPKTFNVLAAEAVIHDDHAPAGRGKPFLGVFKADVDNLGFIFSFGLGDRLSVSRFAAMSRMLNHFFADYLVGRIKRDFPDIYVVFAGGDDLFLLGPWTDIVDFALEVRREFGRFVADNPAVTLSAGLALGRPGLPVQTAAHEAEEQLEASKAHVPAMPGGARSGAPDAGRAKDALTLFGVTASWRDVEELLAWSRWLEELILTGKITRGMAHRLLGYAEDCRAFHNGDIRRGIYLSHLQYDLVRNAKPRLTEPDFAKLAALKDDAPLMRRLRLPLSHALYRIRTE